MYQLAADQGDPQAQYYIGDMHRMGYGVERDEAGALRWYNLSAAQDNEDANEILSALAGNAAAQGELGKSHYDCYTDYGQQEELNEAIKWLTSAAKGNTDEDALYTLGNIYYIGDGIEKDYQKALNYFILAAKQWNSSAQDRLGDMYRYGHGVPQDNITAYAWYSLAAQEGGDDDATTSITELNKKMNQNDIETAKREAEKLRNELGQC